MAPLSGGFPLEKTSLPALFRAFKRAGVAQGREIKHHNRMMRIFPKHRLIEHLLVATGFAFLAFAIVYHNKDFTSAIIVAGATAVVLCSVFLEKYFRRLIQARKPFPETWRMILENKVDFYKKLDPESRRYFERDIRIFLSEQRIFGVRGQPVSDDIQVMIAASAAILGFGLHDWEWPNLRDILVYPTGFDEEYSSEQSQHFKGMVHHQGPIIFSEEDLTLGYRSSNSGYNVGLHEMAHVLDMADGRADGVPTGLSWFATAPWVKVMADRIQKVRRGECRKILREYAGVNEAEFFAVAVEVFFERPDDLYQTDPELFSLLLDYFNVDPRRPSLISPKNI